MITYDSNLKIFTSSLINDNRFFAGFGTKENGDARHLENVLNFFNYNNIIYKKIIIPEQIHSTNISLFISQDNEKINKIEETDGLITKDSGVILTVITGDCCPLIFADKKSGIIGIAHLGWRGSIRRMAQKMINRMVSVGANIDSIKVALGPSIGECCYNIEDDRYYEFVEEFDGYSEKIFHRRHGKLHLNLTLLNYLLLLKKGIKKENIDHFPFCTRCDKKRFFSYRRDKKSDYGEMFSFIMMSLVNN